MTGWHCVSSPITFNLKASFLVVKYIVLFLITWWCFGGVLQSSNRKSINSCLLAPTERYFLNCFGIFWSLLEAVTLIERLVACRYLSHDLIEACQYWSTVKNIFQELLLVIQVSIKSDRQPNISKPLGRCWTMHISSKTLTQFCGTELSSSFPPEDSVTLISQTWKILFSLAKDQAMGPSEYWSNSLIVTPRFSLITNNLANKARFALMTSSFPLTKPFCVLSIVGNVLSLFFLLSRKIQRGYV